MKNSTAILPYLLLILAASTWGGNIVLGRAMHGDIPPMALAFFRWLVAFSVLLPFTIGKLREDAALVMRHWKWLMLVGVTGIAIFHSFVYVGLTSTTAINAGLMMATAPIIIPAVAFLIHRDRPTRLQVLGIVASLLGVGIIMTEGDLGVLGSLSFKSGDLWVLAAMPMWGVYSVILKDRPKGLSSGSLMLTITGLGTLMLSPFYVWELSSRGGIAFNEANFLTIAYISVFASVIAYFAWNRGVAHVGAIKAGQFLQVIPVSATLLAIVFLGESLQSFHFPGIVLIVSGITFSSWRGRRAEG